MHTFGQENARKFVRISVFRRLLPPSLTNPQVCQRFEASGIVTCRTPPLCALSPVAPHRASANAARPVPARRAHAKAPSLRMRGRGAASTRALPRKADCLIRRASCRIRGGQPHPSGWLRTVRARCPGTDGAGMSERRKTSFIRWDTYRMMMSCFFSFSSMM